MDANFIFGFLAGCLGGAVAQAIGVVIVLRWAQVGAPEWLAKGE
jgi:hypothetical protein